MPSPSPAVGVEKRWRAQFNTRFRTLKGRVNRLMGSNQGAIDAEFVKFFNRWMDSQVNDLFYDKGIATASTIWMATYVNQAFGQGMRTAIGALAKQGIQITQFSKLNSDSLALLMEKSFTDLQGITSEMRAQSSRVLVTGIQDQSSREVIRSSINNRIDKIGRSRSHVLVNTRTTESFNTAEINQAIDAADQSGEEVKLLWITEGDSRVRTTHALRNRRLYDPIAAQRLIGEPNCRCSLRVQVGEGTEAERAEETKIRKRDIKKSRQAQEERRLFESIGTRSGYSPT